MNCRPIVTVAGRQLHDLHPLASFARMTRNLQSSRRTMLRCAAAIGLATSATAAKLAAQAPASRLQFVLPPSTWRLTLIGELHPATSVRSDALRPALHPADVGASRLTARLSAPVWKRGLYTTVVTNDLIYDRFDLSYGPETSLLPVTLPSPRPPFGPRALQSVQHELVVSHSLNPRWRATGVLQHGLFTAGGPVISAESYRAAGGAFITRVYRPTLQIGAGVIALNVAPYVIPTIRILHVGAKWRSDVLLPRAESFRAIGHGIEVGGVLRFTGNRWLGDDKLIAESRITRVTYQQATLGPAATIRVATRGLVQLETGVALRRMLVEGDVVTQILTSTSPSRFARRFDAGAGALLRLSGRLTF